MRIVHLIAFVGLIRVADADTALGIEIEQAMDRGAKQHPQARDDQASVRAAEARTDVERARYFPDVEVFGQLDRTTSNTSVGVLFPEPGIPVLSGAAGRSLGPGSFGSAVGVTASWDVLGYRRWDAQIAAADAETRIARDDGAVTSLDRGFLVGDRFIAVITQNEAVTAARAGVERARVFVTIVKASVDQNLRPGADLSRADAELSLAETALIRAESGAEVALARYAEAFGSKDPAPPPIPGKLLDPAPRVGVQQRPVFDVRMVATTARIDAAKARKAAIETGTQPRLAVVGALWARGGNDPGGIGAVGLVPDVPNWTLGLVLTWPVLAGKLVDPQGRVEDANVARGQAHVDALVEHERSLVAQATSLLDAAYRISDSTPVTLKAARDAEQQSLARYQAKLATADDVAQAQRLLEQAEIDDAVARLDVWRAILRYAYARGDLELFLTPYREAGH